MSYGHFKVVTYLIPIVLNSNYCTLVKFALSENTKKVIIFESWNL